jgi:pimeloyl-ACP methyl ester carboxylesterase
MSEEDANRAHSLIAGNRLIEIESGHDIHYEKPPEFVATVQAFVQSLSGQ